jgi:hypothetical protein
MKRFLIAGVTSLALLAGASARAEANGFGFGVGVGLNFNWSCWSCCQPACPVPVDFVIPIVPQNDYIPMRPIGPGVGGH